MTISTTKLMSKEYQIVLCTCPDQKIAKTLAEMLVTQALAACVNIIPTIQSIFYWQGKLEKTEEALLIIKTMNTHYAELELMIKKHHPYETPEIIALSIDQGSEKYLAFIQHSLEKIPSG